MHLVVSLAALVSLAVIEWVLRVIGIDKAQIPGFQTTLGSWILDLEIVASSAIIILGVVEALVVLLLGIILDCVTRIREIRRAWRS